MAKTLKDIKVGDRVWVSARYGKDLRTVARLTPKRIVLDDKLPEYHTYDRGKPSRYAPYEPTYYGIGMSDGEITFIATRHECEAWDAKQARQMAEREAVKDAASKRETLRQELAALFPEGFYIQETHNNLAGEWQVYVYATEQRVRNLAQLIKAGIV